MHRWIADRTQTFDSSGIRKVFELGAKLKNPINFSIGQPDFDVPEPARQAAIDAINSRKNGYSLTQGIGALRERLQAQVAAEYGHEDRQVFVTSGTSGGLVLAMMTLVNPGDEVIVFDPFFVMYEPLVKLVGGVVKLVDTYPDFRIDLNQVAAAISDKTKAILFNSPANPTGVLASEDDVRGLARLAAEYDVALVSDEIYRVFCYDGPFYSPAQYNPDTIVIDGFSKSYAMTGWRVGYLHGPSALIQEMIKLQQYSFVCAPQPLQWGCIAAIDLDMTEQVDLYRRKRNMLLEGLGDLYEIAHPGGAFYLFPAVPSGTATEFCEKAIEHELLIIPGKNFSRKDTHFRISYATDEATIARGIEVLRKMARG